MIVLPKDLENSKIDNKISNIVNNLGQKTLIDTMSNINKFLSNKLFQAKILDTNIVF